jgi:hypothetical protein
LRKARKLSSNEDAPCQSAAYPDYLDNAANFFLQVHYNSGVHEWFHVSSQKEGGVGSKCAYGVF